MRQKDNIKLKSLIEAKPSLNEAELVEPSEQILKGVQKELKLKTGIVAVLGLRKKGNTEIYYTTDLSKEIRTPVLQQLFDVMTLDVTCAPMKNAVGGYAFSVSINYKHPTRGSNGLDLGTIFYENNKFKSRFYSESRKFESPY